MMLSNSWLGNTSNYLSVEVAVNIRKLGTLPESQEAGRSEEHTSELQSQSTISYAVFCLKKKKKQTKININAQQLSHHNTRITTPSSHMLQNP